MVEALLKSEGKEEKGGSPWGGKTLKDGKVKGEYAPSIVIASDDLRERTEVAEFIPDQFSAINLPALSHRKCLICMLNSVLQSHTRLFSIWPNSISSGKRRGSNTGCMMATADFGGPTTQRSSKGWNLCPMRWLNIGETSVALIMAIIATGDQLIVTPTAIGTHKLQNRDLWGRLPMHLFLPGDACGSIPTGNSFIWELYYDPHSDWPRIIKVAFSIRKKYETLDLTFVRIACHDH